MKLCLPAQKDYPKYVYLKADRWRIVFVKSLKHVGETDPENNVIRMRSGMSRNEMFRTFIHECIHLGEFSWPYNIKHKLVYQLEEAIFSFLIDNFME